MKLVCGLGNPGSKYESTRHNAGFMLVDRVAEDFDRLCIVFSFRGTAPGPWKQKDGALVAEGQLEGEKLVFVKPITFMNCSGEPLQKLMRFYKADIGDLIVVHDELDLNLGRLQLRKGGGHGGHNGLKSIFANLGSGDFARLRFGIGRPPADWKQGGDDISGWVLGKFSDSECHVLENGLTKAKEAVAVYLFRGLVEAQRMFN